MASYNKFNCFVQNLHEGEHNFTIDTIKIALTATQPSPLDLTISDIEEVTSNGGYPSGGISALVTYSQQVNGTYTLKLQDTTFTSTGYVDPFRYIVIYNFSSTEKSLICWYDHGAQVALEPGESYFFNFDQVLGLFSMS